MMKHIFLVHSSITYLMALSVICKEKLQISDIRILSFRNVGFPKVVPILCSENEMKNGRRWNYVKNFDKIIGEIAEGEKYDAYIPSMSDNARLLVTNALCREFHIIEEGTASYITEMDKETLGYEYRMQDWRCNSLLDKIKVLKDAVSVIIRGMTMKLQTLSVHTMLYAPFENHIFYACNEHAFPYAANRKIVSLRNELTEKIKPAHNLSSSYIWVSSDITRDYQNKKDQISALYEKLLSAYFKSHNEKPIYIKFHQFESEQSKEWTYRLFHKIGKSPIVLPDCTIMEMELLNCQDVTMIGDFSSLLLYNQILGHHSVSLVKPLSRIVNLPESDYSMIKAEFLE